MTAYQTRPRQQRSITSHRLFPPLVALWFGALFGLSSLAVRTELFEAMVISSGFDRLFPAASPPLGHTARLLIALVFGVIGGGLGYFVARLVAGPARPSTYDEAFYPPAGAPAPNPVHDDYRVRARDAHPDAPARRPISAHAELGDESFVAGGAPASDWPASDWPASECAIPADDAGDQLPHPGPHPGPNPGTPEAVATIQALRDALSSLRSS